MDDQETETTASAAGRRSSVWRVLDVVISEPVVILLIVLNAGVFFLLREYPPLPDRVGDWVLSVDYFCVAFFVVEAALKIAKLGFKDYFRSRWNTFDFVVVLASAPLLLEPVLDVSAAFASTATLFRLARLLRLMRLLHYVRAVKTIMVLQGPVYLILFVAALKVLILEDPTVVGGVPDAVAGILRQAYDFLVVFAGFWLLARMYELIDGVYLVPLSRREEPRIDGFLLTFIRMSVTVACLFLGAIFGLQNAGHDPFTILAGLGIGGLAVAFAAQDLVANIISGLMLFVQRPFKMGDLVRTNGHIGWVRGINLRSLTVETFFGEMVTIPNRAIVENPLINIDRRDSYVIHQPLRLHHDTPPEKVQRALDILNEIVSMSGIHRQPRFIGFEKIDDGSFVIEFWYLIELLKPDERDDYYNYYTKILEWRTRVNLAIMRRFADEGIRLGMPIEGRLVEDAGPAASQGRPDARR